jgi:hypothetical protein
MLGAHSELMVKEFLFRGGLTSDDARQSTLLVAPPVNGEQLLRQRQVDAAALGDIYRDRAYGVAGQGGLMSDRELQVWLDWMVKDGERQPGQISPERTYTNELNPYLPAPGGVR